MVFNVTKDDIRVRMAVVEEETWSPPAASPAERLSLCAVLATLAPLDDDFPRTDDPIPDGAPPRFGAGSLSRHAQTDRDHQAP